MRGILVEENGDVIIADGHLAIGDNRMQCARQLTEACTGEYKHAPTLGGNVRRMLSGEADPFWAGDVRKQLSQCGIDVERIRVENQVITIELND